MIKLINNTDRNKLSEGRSYQMGFGFAKKTDNDTYEMVTPISACKDFLNDVVWTEAVKKPSNVYGLLYEKQDIYDKEYAYIVISILNKKSGTYSEYEKDVERLENNYKILESFINFFEETLTEDIFTKIDKIEDNKYLVKVPLLFIRGTYLISLYSLLLRAGQYWDGKQNPEDFLNTFNAFLPDVALVKQSFVKLKKLIEKGYVEQDLSKLPSTDIAHNCGIITFNGFNL
jgi:hypothetical protein